MYTYARKTSQAIWQVSMDQCDPDGLNVFPACRPGLPGKRPASLVTLRSFDRGASAGAALPDLPS